ncbi:DUF6443 domain-containing protein [Sphingobacterium siyangense]|uniref:DUF6443 domain-containing protein n=1 Tax=Sphingobacterium siyangense TaxID=459529 RepID=UPI0019645A53|nr:DUF6443 domain-containing protein [Sphingobacterium siyangense]QRY55551.1 hypothetical protein JVX97_16040 [Sphingobacterium siyangense]
MKKILTSAILLLAAIAAGQDSQNYIQNTTYKIKTGSSISSPSASQAVQGITYLDGLGRPIQERAYKQSATGKDIVTHIEYDALGRLTKTYLPYPSSSSSLDYDPNARTATLQHYSNAAPPALLGSETTLYPYSESFFEASPLGRILKQSAPGDAWKGNPGDDNDRTVKTAYLTNTAADNVQVMLALSSWSAGSGLYIPAFSKNGSYPEGELYKTITKNENWTAASGSSHIIQEFTNKKGQLILKRTYGASVVGTSETAVFHDTYYVYDQFGNLSFVLPPLSDYSGSTQDLEGLCYQYRYDHRKRQVEKKLPGKDWEFTIYDNLDRVVATGPALSPFTNFAEPNNIGWLFTKYDTFGRAAYTGWMPATVNSSERASLQSARNAQTANLNEAKIATATNTTVNGVAFRYTNEAWPTGTGWHVLTVNYYDDYNFPNAPSSFADVEGQAVFYNLTVKPKGLQTGTWTRVLETSTLTKNELSYTLYDYKARPIRTYATNYLGGYNQVDTSLDFLGKPIYSITRHKRLAGSAELVVREDFAYTDQGRLLSNTHQTASNPTELLAKYEYDGLGQLIVKRVGGTDLTGNLPLQKIDYSYNARGWLKEVNKISALAQAGAPTDLFAFKLSYNTVTAFDNYTSTPLYNGNISEMHWISGDGINRAYSYSYDALDRLKKAAYIKGASFAHTYDEELSYDKNGNIVMLGRMGHNDSSPLEIDQLVYTYHGQHKNRLMMVEDKSANPNGFKDGPNLDDDYAYDSMGNMLADKNKGITKITYNHLNQPWRIEFESFQWRIEYLYNAAGEKVRKSVPYLNENGIVSYTTMDYLDGFHYQGTALKFFPTKEGYVEKTGEFYSYVYNYTDHQGNIRLSYSKDPENPNVLKIIEENHYYPFGLKHSNYNSGLLVFKEDPGLALRQFRAPVNLAPPLNYDYKYQGQERHEELGLNWDSFKWRNYDYAIGRFMNVDPLAEEYSYQSPYNFAENRVVDGNELEGLEWKPTPDKAENFDKRLQSGLVTGAVNRLNDYAVFAVNAFFDPAGATKEVLKTTAEAIDGTISTIENPVGSFNNTAAALQTKMKTTQDPVDGMGQFFGAIATDAVALEILNVGASRLFSFGSKSANVNSTKAVAKPTVEAPVTDVLYKRPNNATTAAQRKSVQGKPCVDCGGKSKPMVANHKKALVEEHYTTGKIDLKKMRSLNAVNSHCLTCSRKQGGVLSNYSKKMKKIIKNRKKSE